MQSNFIVGCIYSLLKPFIIDNEKKLNVLGLIIKLVIAVPALIFGFIVMTSGVNAESKDFEKLEFMDSFAFNGVMNISLYAIAITIVLILIFFVVLLITRPVRSEEHTSELQSRP